MLRGPACQVLSLAAVKKNPGKPGLPAYAAMMADYHRAFAPGLKRCQAQGVVFTRQAPLDHAARSFFTAYLENLWLRVGPHLEPSLRELFDRLSNPRSKLFPLSSPDLTVTCVNQVVIGIKSSQRRIRKN